MRVLILGCGYVGTPLGAELVRRGHEVFGARRSSAASDQLISAGIKPLIADITRKEDLAQLPSPFDWIINLVSSTHGGAEDYRHVYFEGTRNILDWLANAPPRKYVYTSSTGVYGQDDGSQVQESSPTKPDSQTGQVLVQTEQLLARAFAEQAFPAVILRVAGIYGPGRTYFLRQFLRNEAKIAAQGQRFMNMIHLEDLVGVVCACLESAPSGEVFNAVDEQPVRQLELYRWMAETLGKELPPFSDDEEASSRKRGVTNKKVLNRKLRERLGYRFKFPTYRQGYTEEIRRLDPPEN
jgi:nucleoside-diphosphate-sugar epimerase